MRRISVGRGAMLQQISALMRSNPRSFHSWCSPTRYAAISRSRGEPVKYWWVPPCLWLRSPSPWFEQTKTKYMSMRQKNKASSITCVNFHLFDLWALQAAGTGATVMGFPNGGVATTVNDGTDFTWGDLPIIAAGNTYDLCWCNGTASACEYLGIDGHGGWPGWMEFQVEESEKIHVFFFFFFLGVLEFADVLMMFVKQNWTKKGSMDGGDAKIYVYILYIDFLFVCLNLELVSFQISTFQFPINPSTLHVSQPEAEDGSGLLGPFGSLAFWRAFRRTSKRNGSLSCRLTMWDQQFWGTSHWEARTELVSKGFGAKFCQRVCWLD